MFNKTKVTTSLYGLVGFEQPANPDYAIVDAANLVSRSGRYATENPYCKIEYLKDNQDYKDATDEQFNTMLEGLQKRSISEVMDSVLMEPDYIDRQLLYQFANNKVNTDALPSDSFVGYRIQKSLDKNVAFELPRILLEFEGDGDIELLLFNSAVNDPIEQKVITISSTQQIEALGWRVDNTDEYFQGEWYLGYRTAGVSVTPIRRDYQNALRKSCITHMQFDNIQVSNVTTDDLFDLDTIDGADECWGLNPDVIVYNDYTDLVSQHEAIFAPAIQMQMAINSIENYVASLRSNRNERMSTDQINIVIAQLEGVPDRIVGFKPTLHKLIKSLNDQITRLKDGMFSTGFELNTLS